MIFQREMISAHVRGVRSNTDEWDFNCSLNILPSNLHSVNAVSSIEHKLMVKLLDAYPRYGDRVRPLHNSSSSIPVKLGLALQKFSLQEEQETLTTIALLNIVSVWWKKSYIII